MYAGHAALALAAKSRWKALPIALLVPVAFAPDWIELLLRIFGHPNREFSHSLVSVGLGSTLVALLYFAYSRVGWDAVGLWLTYVSHWPADFITGTKPTWPGGPDVGLLLYAHPLLDVIVESILIVVCFALYRRSLPKVSQRRVIVWLVPLGLIGMQIAFAAAQAPNLW